MRYFQSKVQLHIPEAPPFTEQERDERWASLRKRLRSDGEEERQRPMPHARPVDQVRNDEVRRDEAAAKGAVFVHRGDGVRGGVPRLYVVDRVREYVLAGIREEVVVDKVIRDLRGAEKRGDLVVWPNASYGVFRANVEEPDQLQVFYAVRGVEVDVRRKLGRVLKGLDDVANFSEDDIYRVPADSRVVARGHELGRIPFEQVLDDFARILGGMARDFQLAYPDLEIEDMEQVARIALWQARGSFPGGVPFRAYARGAMRNALLKMVERHDRRAGLDVELPDEYDVASDVDLVVEAALTAEAIEEVRRLPGGRQLVLHAMGCTDAELGGGADLRLRRFRLREALRAA